MYSRRRLLAAAIAGFAGARMATAQRTSGRPKIGFVLPTSPGPRSEAFIDGLRLHGYVPGRNVTLVMLSTEGVADRWPRLVDEVLAHNVDVLVVGSTIGARAASKATASVPIVFAGSSDPTAGGVVTSLARPDGNVTGFSLAYGDRFAGEWLELLLEAAPSVGRAAVLWTSSNPAAVNFVQEIAGAGRGRGIAVDAHQASNLAELEQAFAAVHGSGVIVTPSPFAATNASRYIEFAAARRLPAIYFVEDFVEAGGLMSYGPSITDSYRRAAAYVDRILKGAHPRELPVQQDNEPELVINIATARALGLPLPKALLARARVAGQPPAQSGRR